MKDTKFSIFGEGGIRTPGSLTTTSVFKTDAFNRSATSPMSFKNPMKKYPTFGWKAGNASRTRDMHLGKVPLYH
jgi:hypothetical protein